MTDLAAPIPSDWERRYRASGFVEGTADGRTVRMDVPASFRAVVVPAAEGVEPQFLVYGAFERSKGVGISFSLQGLELANLHLIAPNDNGSLTITVKPEASLPWLTLAEGESSTALANQGRYRLTVNRVGLARWHFAVAVAPGGPPPYPAFSDGVLDLSVSSPMPPWEAISLQVDAHSATGRFAAAIRLQSD
ncbi:MAG: hypothetical protein QOK43_2111 [Acidimicrobiaceae bacterium]|nr:hypothetical protein [Acidimicrobiaceae bacterium]